MERGQFTFYRSFWDAVKELPPKGRTEVICAVCEYVFEEINPQLSGVSKAVFSLIKPTLDTAARKAANGKLGGSKPKANSKQKENKKEIEGEKEKEKEIEIEKESYISPSVSPPSPKKFIPPTIQEVEAYCLERQNGVDPRRFVNHYTSNGWRVGKNPMKDWKAAVRTWESTEREEGRNDRGSTGCAAAERERPARDYVIVSAKLD